MTGRFLKTHDIVELTLPIGDVTISKSTAKGRIEYSLQDIWRNTVCDNGSIYDAAEEVKKILGRAGRDDVFISAMSCSRYRQNRRPMLIFPASRIYVSTSGRRLSLIDNNLSGLSVEISSATADEYRQFNSATINPEYIGTLSISAEEIATGLSIGIDYDNLCGLSRRIESTTIDEMREMVREVYLHSDQITKGRRRIVMKPPSYPDSTV